MFDNNLGQKKKIQNAQLFYGCLHFRYNSKNYLYNLTQQLLQSPPNSSLLSKLNCCYKPTPYEIKTKSSLQIHYIILSRNSQRIGWHVRGVKDRIRCGRFLVVGEKGSKVDDQGDKRVRKVIYGMIEMQYKNKDQFQLLFFREHSNFKHSKSNIDNLNSQQLNNHKQILLNTNSQHNVNHDGEIYEEQLQSIIMQLFQQKTKLILQNHAQLNMSFKQKELELRQVLTQLQKQKTQQQQSSPLLKLTATQLHSLQLKYQTLLYSFTPIYPTSPTTLLLLSPTLSSQQQILIHRQQILIINPSPLVGGYLTRLELPKHKVGYVVLTRKTLHFMELLLGVGSKDYVNHGYIVVITIKQIFNWVKQQLTTIFLWDHQMIKAKIGFRVIDNTKPNFNKQLHQYKLHYFTSGWFKVAYQQLNTNVMWRIKFGDKQIGYIDKLDQIDVNFEILKSRLKQLSHIIISNISHQQKTTLPKHISSQLLPKLIYPQSSPSLLTTITSSIQIPLAFLPIPINSQQISLLKGQSINGLKRNIIVREGMVMIFYREKYRVIMAGERFVAGRVNCQECRLRNMERVLAIVDSVIIVQESEDQDFYCNSNLITNNNSQSNIDKHNQQSNHNNHLSNQSLYSINHQVNINYKKSKQNIKFQELQVYKVHENSLIACLCHNSNNLHLNVDPSPQETTPMISYLSPVYLFSQLLSPQFLKSSTLLPSTKFYLIIKGLLKYKNTQEYGRNGWFVGDLRGFSQGKEEEIEVVKDSWVLQGGFRQVYDNFFTQYPQVFTFLINKGRLSI